jgi:propionyl-CoA carboxylase alpha chain
MNTRLQVEHPVTEEVTGLDLVAEQIRIAEGAPLGYTQDDFSLPYGHAVECRVYAEDPAVGFLPAPGPLLRHAPPAGFGVRVDAGVEQGGEVPIYYDPMISKLTTWGRTREEAIRRMDRALGEYEVAGVPTTIPFCRFVMQHEAFRSGRFSTHFVQEHFVPEDLLPSDDAVAELAALAATLYRVSRNGTPGPAASGPSGAATSTRETSRWVLRRR